MVEKVATIFDEVLIIVLAIALFGHGFFHSVSPASEQVLIVLSVLGIIPVVISTIRALVKWEITIDLLAAIALVFTFVQGQWVSAAFINLMLASARLFDAITAERTRRTIEKLLKLRPAQVTVKQGGVTKEVPLKDLKVGDLVIVEEGERIPADGIIVSGQAAMDQSTLTGESEVVPKKVGDQVFTSSLNTYGGLIIRAERVGEDTTLAKIIALTAEASRQKTKIERIASRFSAWYIVLTLLGTGALYYFTGNLNLILSILLVTCADDIAVAVPLAFTMAIARAAHEGIVVKGGAALERLVGVNAIITDKTGTITRGAAAVAAAVPSPPHSETELLTAASITAGNSHHPADRAIGRFLSTRRLVLRSPDQLEEVPGEGIKVVAGGVEYLSGRPSFLASRGVAISEAGQQALAHAAASGVSVVALAAGKDFLGYFTLEDKVKPAISKIIAATKKLGIKRWIMITGDNPAVAARVAAQTGIDEYHAEIKPAEKVALVKDIKQKFGTVLMLGDGFNDAAALALADVSVAMGAIGADASIEAADITLMHDDVKRVPEAITLSRFTMRIVKENFGIWAVTNAAGLLLVFGGILGPAGAAAYNFLTDFLPILNSARVYLKKH